MRALRIWLAICLVLAPGLMAAQDYLSTNGPLSDEDFYRLVACRAEPGAACQEPFVRWAARDATDLTLSIVDIKPKFPTDRVPAISRAISAAIEQINSSGAALDLRQVADGTQAHISVYLWDQKEGDTIRGLPQAAINGQTLGSAYVHVWWDDKRHLSEAVILIAKDIQDGDIRSILLEEITQAMGLLTDIDNPWYERRSIFSERGNWVITLQPQDLAALRRHYPKY